MAADLDAFFADVGCGGLIVAVLQVFAEGHGDSFRASFPRYAVAGVVEADAVEVGAGASGGSFE